MLSKPDVESSDGRYFAASMSRSSRSRTTLAYSVRFSRCSPGGGVNGFAVRSSSFSNEAIIVLKSAGSGRFMPTGGICPRAASARPAPTSGDPCPRWPGRGVHRQPSRRVQARGLGLLAVAGHAVPVQECFLSVRADRRRGWGCRAAVARRVVGVLVARAGLVSLVVGVPARGLPGLVPADSTGHGQRKRQEVPPRSPRQVI